MKRRNFIELLAVNGAALGIVPTVSFQSYGATDIKRNRFFESNDLTADLVIAGGGLGGCAAALAALRNGLNVILTEETDWIGGQLTQQGVPPDEHYWIETHGAPQLYRDFRTAVRQYYKNNYPLTEDARSRKNLDPGDGGVSRLCHEPKVALAVLQNMMAPYISSGKLILLTEHKINGADVSGDKVRALKAFSLKTGREKVSNSA
jgi:hypothetical protein